VKHRKAALAAAAVSIGMLAAPSAVAAKTDARACTAAHDSAVTLRTGKHLREARQQLALCAAASCSTDVRKECARLSADVDAAIPTIIFTARDASGHDVKAVEVDMDGQALADSLDGSALEVDPGVHVFTFTADSWAPVTLKLDIGAGEKRRAEPVTMTKVLREVVVAPPPPAEVHPPPPSSPPAKTDTVGIITGGLGFAGFAGMILGGVYGMLAITSRDQQKADCSSTTQCGSHSAALTDHSTALSDGTVSTVAFIAGGVFLAGAAGYYFGVGGSSPSSGTTGVLIAPTVLRGGSGLALQGGF